MHDVIIVGARVAGSATALLLARAGLKVLVVDRATFPSDTLSTHQVQVPGVARLARWGVLDTIMAAGTPPTRTVRFDQGGRAVFSARMPTWDGVDMMCSPRRTVLDAALLDAARADGAEVRENFITEDLVACDGTVTGIRGQEKGSPSVTERAALVIGADGQALDRRPGGRRGELPRETAAVDGVLHLLGGRAGHRRRALRPAGMRGGRLADQRRAGDDVPGVAQRPLR